MNTALQKKGIVECLILAALAGLLLSAFTAATLLPMQSEAVLVGLLVTKNYPVWILVAVASVGNVLGAVVNWGLGRAFMRLEGRPWFPASTERIEQANAWYRDTENGRRS